MDSKMKYLWMGMLMAGVSACNAPQEQAALPVAAPQTVTPQAVAAQAVAPKLAEEEVVAPVAERNAAPGLTGTGKVKAARYTDLYFRSQEQIAHVYVKNGSRVAKGQKLADLEQLTLNANLRQAEISLEQAKLELQDILIGQGYDSDKMEMVSAEMMKLARVKSGYEQASLQVENARREIELATLTAPYDGVVANLTAKPYHMASSSEPFCRIIQTSNMEVEFQVLENELHLIKMGQAVEIEPHATTVGKLKGEICTLNPMVDEKGMIQVRARVKGSVGLMEGMNVTVRIQP